MSVIELRGIKKQSEDFTLEIPQLQVEEGFITGFVGQNGAGKTTTIKLIMDLIRPDQGEIKIFGKKIQDDPRGIREKIGYVGDPTGFAKELRIGDLKKMIKPFYKTWDEALYKRYINHFKLQEKDQIKNLSQGQNKQIALALTLARRPKLIILDEPTANLDPIVRNYLLDVLMEHMQEEDASVFYSTHITSDLDKAADYIIYIKNGQIVFNKDKEELDEHYYIVKGKKALLIPEVEKHLIGCKKKKETFEALTNNYKEIFKILGNEGIYNKASIEEIMITYERQK